MLSPAAPIGSHHWAAFTFQPLTVLSAVATCLTRTAYCSTGRQPLGHPPCRQHHSTIQILRQQYPRSHSTAIEVDHAYIALHPACVILCICSSSISDGKRWLGLGYPAVSSTPDVLLCTTDPNHDGSAQGASAGTNQPHAAHTSPAYRQNAVYLAANAPLDYMCATSNQSYRSNY
jgi:hypothetical protein